MMLSKYISLTYTWVKLKDYAISNGIKYSVIYSRYYRLSKDYPSLNGYLFKVINDEIYINEDYVTYKNILLDNISSDYYKLLGKYKNQYQLAKAIAIKYESVYGETKKVNAINAFLNRIWLNDRKSFIYDTIVKYHDVIKDLLNEE